MDKKWVEKDEKINKTYNEMKEKNPQFSEKFPDIKNFCEAINPTYKSAIEEEKKSSEAANNGEQSSESKSESEKPADDKQEADKKD
ncbi:MAG TPA: hypothetical protein PKL04_00450 [Methanofastidiosum sp.]|jgi:hypothetical protein|nr:hypothetical protein [Methanofastidiosum sp.]